MPEGEQATDFRSWLSISWAKACRTGARAGTEEAIRHEEAGTSVKVYDELRGGDPIALEEYFAKHGYFEAKRYQDIPRAVRRAPARPGAPGA